MLKSEIIKYLLDSIVEDGDDEVVVITNDLKIYKIESIGVEFRHGTAINIEKEPCAECRI